MQKEYTLNELIKSTQARMAYNVDLAQKAFARNAKPEFKCFMQNAKMMIQSIEWAIEDNNTDYLINNRDW